MSLMKAARALLLILALETAENPRTRYASFRRPKWAYFATCFVRPDEYRLLGFADAGPDLEALWQPTGQLRRVTR